MTQYTASAKTLQSVRGLLAATKNLRLSDGIPPRETLRWAMEYERDIEGYTPSRDLGFDIEGNVYIRKTVTLHDTSSDNYPVKLTATNGTITVELDYLETESFGIFHADTEGTTDELYDVTEIILRDR